MPNSIDFANFSNSFMRGFSFIDDINHRKRQERKLDERLKAQDEDRAFRRKVLENRIAIEGADRANRLTDRQERKQLEQRTREATAIFSDPNAGREELAPYLDLPFVSAALRQKELEDQKDAQTRSDLEQIFRGGAPGVTAQGSAVGPDQVTEQPSDQGLSSQVAAAALPSDELAAPPPLTGPQLNNLADEGGFLEAQAVRDAQGVPAAATPPRETLKARGQRQSKKALVNNEWEAFNDIEDTSGDALRSATPSQITSKYFQDRSNLDEKTRQVADQRMAPVVAENIKAQEVLLSQAEPGTRDVANASRKLSESYGLANAIGIQYKPLGSAGVDDRGLPIGNEQLANAVIEKSVSAAPNVLPLNPQQTRVDTALINRGASGKRVSEALASAAYRQLKDKNISMQQYESIIRTGRLPVAAPKVVQRDPKKDTYIVYPDGTEVLKQAARDVSKEATKNARNMIGDEGVRYIRDAAKALNTEDDKQRGFNITTSFMQALNDQEARARQLGYDFSNIGDVAALWQRWTQLHVIQDQFNDEIFYDGQFFPVFAENYGTLPEALFNSGPKSVDRVVGPDGEVISEGIDRQSIADFNLNPLEGFTDPAAPLDEGRLTLRQQVDPEFYDEVRRNVPELEGASDAQIESVVSAQEEAARRQLGR